MLKQAKKRGQGRQNAVAMKRGAEEIVLSKDSRPTIVDELRPSRLDELTFFPKLDQQLVELAASCRDDMPNLLFYGPSGAGKSTRAHALLVELFSGFSAEKEDAEGKAEERAESILESCAEHKILQVDCSGNKSSSASPQSLLSAGINIFVEEGEARKMVSRVGGGKETTNGNKRETVEVACVQSPFHMEITPSDVDRKDVYVIQTCVKQLATNAIPLDLLQRITRSIDTSATSDSASAKDKKEAEKADEKKRKAVERRSVPGYRVILINAADELHFDAQAAMRRFMEDSVSNIRFILLATKISQLIPAIRSRCLPIRVPAPSEATIANSLQKVAQYLQVGGTFGGNRNKCPCPPTADPAIFFNESNNAGLLPYPTGLMLTKAARGDYTYAQLLLVTNHCKEGSAKPKSAKSGGSKRQQKPLTHRDKIDEPSWVETTKKIARALVLGYGAVREDEKTFTKAVGADMGHLSYEVPMLKWMRRVAHEFISRCIPLGLVLHRLLFCLLENIDFVARRTKDGTRKPPEDFLYYTVCDETAWTIPKCDALRCEVIELIAFYETRLITAYRPIIQLDTLFVCLQDACEVHRGF